MFVKASEAITEPSIHKTPKQVFLRQGVLPGVTQVATATLEPGVQIEPHTHPTMYEVYYMLSGRAVYHVGDQAYDVGPGDFVVVPPGTLHYQTVMEGPHRIFYWGLAVEDGDRS
jgi:quercetin dioxygenase-like cupin family protein